MLYNLSLLKLGLKVIQNNEPCIIISNECIKPGKGQSFNRVRFKQIKSGKIIEKTLKSGELLESANVIEIKLVHVYRDGELWYFMNKNNFDQISIHSKVIGDVSKWITVQCVYTVTFWNDNPILVTPPDCLQLTVIDTSSIMKSVSVSSGDKLATLNTGAVIKVPFFIRTGEVIKINTHNGTYISRIK